MTYYSRLVEKEIELKLRTSGTVNKRKHSKLGL